MQFAQVRPAVAWSEVILILFSAVDKLDKEEWATVRTEMVETKGLDPVCADRIGEFVKINGAPWDVRPTINANRLRKTVSPRCSTN